MCRFVLIVCGLLGTAADAWAESNVRISDARIDAHGVRIHSVESPFQLGTTQIRVLLPDGLNPNSKYSVLYVLPVEAANGERWGDGLVEVKKADLHNRHGLICVAPTYSHLPWYCDHPTDATIRQESYFTKVVVPFVDRSYPVIAESRGRMLMGFSKSGWGAFSLLLRHPETFSKAAAWDAPLTIDAPNSFGMGPIFGTQESFEQYRIVSLLKERADDLGQEPRLALLGYGNFRGHHQRTHDLMLQFSIPHVYQDGPKRAHHWSSGWVEEAVRFLAESPDNRLPRE